MKKQSVSLVRIEIILILVLLVFSMSVIDNVNLKQGSEYQTSSGFKWWKSVRLSNGSDFECHLFTKLKCQVFEWLSSVFIRIINKNETLWSRFQEPDNSVQYSNGA